jgi:hypothetical protein
MAAAAAVDGLGRNEAGGSLVHATPSPTKFWMGFAPPATRTDVGDVVVRAASVREAGVVGRRRRRRRAPGSRAA